MTLIQYLAICTITLFMPHAVVSQNGKKPPDIVIIIADDIGYSDFGCYGGEIPTPNIDKIASKGIRFTQFHAENMCAASRAALLTGQYHLSGYDKGNNITIAEGLSQGNYQNYAVGKWHNYGEDFKTYPERSAPMERGFNHFFGTPIGAGSFFAPLKLSHEGGIKVPLIIQWPSVIKEGNQISHKLTHMIDILPTVLDAADVKYPNTYDGRHVDPVDGKSLVPFLQGQKFEGHEYLCWSNAHGKAVRQGNWKLVKSDDAPWELYDLEKDPIEVENRAEKYPDKVRKLRKIFDNWLKNN